jgi:hypothetical protein
VLVGGHATAEKRGIWAALGALAVYLFDPVLTIIRQNVEVWSAHHGYDALLRDFALPRPAVMIAGELSRVWAFISGDFALGFAVGALLFSFWDPVARHAGKFFVRDTPRSKKVAMARRWIALSDELFADAPHLRMTPTPLGALPKEVCKDLLQRNEEAASR